MVTAIVGANWGDEGKGKITDLLANDSDIVIRFQGGANAGHTIINEHGRFALHLMPSGVCHDNIVNIIGNGVALDIHKFINEYNEIKERGLNPQLLVSDRVQVVMPYHVDFDKFEEERLGGKAFGSTKSGIAPFFSDKYAKIGFQVSELFDEVTLKEKIERVLEIKNALLVNLYHKDPINPDELLAEMLEQGRLIKPFVTNTQAFLYEAVKAGK
jgi:adenylosuccinate synthase